MQGYSGYSYSGSKWIGDIPSGWSAVRFRNLFTFGKGLSITKENLYDSGIPCVNYGEVHSKYGFELNLNHHTLKCVSEDFLNGGQSSLLNQYDFVFADTSEDLEGSGNFTQLISNHMVFAGYHTVIARPKNGINVKYLAFALHSECQRNQIRSSVKGVKVFSITKGILKNVLIPLPCKEEQEAIANFLGRETARIDNLIAEKQTFINLLKEKRQTLISHVVTKGLDPNVRMKYSGIDWIGEVPEHWDFLSHRRLIDKIEQGWSPQADSSQPIDAQWGVTKLSAVKSGVFYPNECKAMLDEHDPSKGLKVNEGDFLITRANTPELVGDVCVVGDIGGRKIILCDLIYKVVYARSINSRYMMYWFLGQPARAQVKIDARGSSMTMAKIAQSHIKNWKVPIPPTEEQYQAVAYLDERLSKLHSISKEVELSIEYLREHRTALISAAVTGKIDLRNYKEEAA